MGTLRIQEVVQNVVVEETTQNLTMASVGIQGPPGETGPKGDTGATGAAGAAMNPRTQLVEYDDFLGDVATPRWRTQISGGADRYSNPNFGSYGVQGLNRPGFVVLLTGNVGPSGLSGIDKGDAPICLGGGAVTWRGDIKLGTLPSGSDTYNVHAGMANKMQESAESNNGVYFFFSSAHANWKARCAIGGGGTTEVDTGVPAVAGAYVALRIEVNAAASQVQFYIAETLVATITTDIPTGATKPVPPMFKIVKTGGTGFSADLFIDYYYLNQLFTTSR